MPLSCRTDVSVTGQTVVDSTIVSVVKEGFLADAGQSGTEAGHAMIVEVLVVKIVDVVDSFAGSRTRVLVCIGEGASVTGRTVVDSTTVSVATVVRLADAGQSVTDDGH